MLYLCTRITKERKTNKRNKAITLNTIIIRAKRDGLCENGSPKSDIVEYVNSNEVDTFDPIAHYLEHLPRWDGENHVAHYKVIPLTAA